MTLKTWVVLRGKSVWEGNVKQTKLDDLIIEA